MRPGSNSEISVKFYWVLETNSAVLTHNIFATRVQFFLPVTQRSETVLFRFINQLFYFVPGEFGDHSVDMTKF